MCPMSNPSILNGSKTDTTSRTRVCAIATGSEIPVEVADATIAAVLRRHGRTRSARRPGARPAPPRPEDRPRDRGRDRDKDRGRERERPDLSVKGRRDRSELPRRFGEGLVEPPDPRSEPERLAPVEPASSRPKFPLDELPTAAVPEISTPLPTPRPETPERDWNPDLSWSNELEPEIRRAPEPTPAPHGDRPEELFGWGTRPDESFDPDLPPSRTQRQPSLPGSGRPGEIEGQERGRHRVPPSLQSPNDEWPRTGAGEPEIEPRGGHDPRRSRGRGRPAPPPRSRPVPPPQGTEGSVIPETEPGADLEGLIAGPDFESSPRHDEPPRRRGGRAAIRSRGGDWEGPREVPPSQDLEPERPARGLPAPGDFETERRRPPAASAAPIAKAAVDRERLSRRENAGENENGCSRTIGRVSRDMFHAASGCVPVNRHSAPTYFHPRLTGRSARSSLSSELNPTRAWPSSQMKMSPICFRVPATAGPARPEGRRRRRRRGRRRERPKGDLAPSSSIGEPETEFDDFVTEVRPPGPPRRGRPPVDETLGDLDDLDIDDLDEGTREGFEIDEFASDELAVIPVAPGEEEIDLELEQEIRREIEEIEELEREMGLRAPADARPKRGEEPARGGRSGRGRGLLKPPIQEIFRRGDEVLVQVIKESIGTKGPTLSTYISIPGRYLVLMPGLNRVGVSRKIVDEGQRRKLRDIMRELNPPQGLGFIVRTAGLERTKRELARDLAYLLRLWKVILRRIKKAKAPAPIYQESDMIIRTIRDIFNSEIDTIWIDEPSAFERAQDFLRVVMPRFVNRLKLYDEKVPLFHKYGIEDEIAKIQRRHVPLPEGGSIVIDQTEALVAIDVNSGNFRVEDDAERTAYEMNLRAAKEIARQLRLRDLGGVIVNDFIDMREERHRRGVERAVREAIKRDRARTKVLRMSAFGLIEMTRQRIRPSLKRSVYEDCHHCTGAGVIKTAESMAIDVMRLLALATHREEIRRIAISVHPSVAAYLGNRKRKEIARLESECNMTIQIGFDPSSPAEHLKSECFDANGNEVRMFPAPASTHKRGH